MFEVALRVGMECDSRICCRGEESLEGRCVGLRGTQRERVWLARWVPI